MRVPKQKTQQGLDRLIGIALDRRLLVEEDLEAIRLIGDQVPPAERAGVTVRRFLALLNRRLRARVEKMQNDPLG